MQKQELLTVITYSNWATDRILQTAAQLTPEEFISPVTPNPGWGSIRGTLLHMLNAETCWRSRMQTGHNDSDRVEADFPDVAALVAQWNQERQAWQQYVASLDEEQINAHYSYQDNFDPEHPTVEDHFRRWHTFQHVLNHSTQHRAEVAAMLTGFAHSPGELDFENFLRERRE